MKRWAELNAGYSVLPYARQIGRLVFTTKTRTILDYGCGAGQQYDTEGIDRMWGVSPDRYDPLYRRYQEKPTGVYDGVICTDVLHHVPARQLADVIADLAALTRKWCFVTVAAEPSRRPWWRDTLAAAFEHYAERVYVEFMP